MRQSSTDLYQLINSLTTAEKRHFHRLAHLHRAASPTYYRYFEVLLKIDNPGAIQEETVFEDTPYSNHLPVIKRRLYEKLLYALDDLHRRSDPEERIKAELHESYLLLKKGLTRAAKTRLRKTAKQLDKHDFAHLWPQYQRMALLLDEHWLRRGYPAPKSEVHFSKNWDGQLNELKEQIEAQFYKLETYAAHYSDLSSSVHRQTQEAVVLSPNKITRADQLQVLAFSAFTRQEFIEARQYNEALLSTLRELDGQTKTVPERILSTTYNLLLDYLKLGEYRLLEQGLQELRLLPSQPNFSKLPRIRSKVFEWGFQLELNAYLRQGEWSAGAARLDKLQKGLKRYGPTMSAPAFASLHHLGGLMAFHSGLFSKGLDLLQPLYHDQRPTAARDVYRFARYLHLLCHYRLGHYETAESLLSGLRKPKNDTSAAEWQLDTFLAKLIRHPENERKILAKWQSDYLGTDTAVERYLLLSFWIDKSKH